MELGEGVNAEEEGRSKLGKSVVREIFSQRALEVVALADLGCQTSPKTCANLLQSFLM